MTGTQILLVASCVSVIVLILVAAFHHSSDCSKANHQEQMVDAQRDLYTRMYLARREMIRVAKDGSTMSMNYCVLDEEGGDDFVP